MILFVLTGTCGAGKSTILKELGNRLDGAAYCCVDSDDVGLNWWDHAGTDHESQYVDDCLKEAARLAGDKHIVFGTCMDPWDYFTKHTAPESVEATFFIALSASSAIIEQRLMDRPAERGFTTSKSRQPHIEYEKRYIRNRSKFQLFIDTSAQTPGETADIIARHILKWS